MKRILFVIGILLFMASNAFPWGTYYKQFSSSGNNQELMAVDASHYARIMMVYVVNDGATTCEVTVHFEGTAGALNRIAPPISLAAGEGVILDLPKDRAVTGPKGADIDIDMDANTTINAFIVYEVSSHR